MLTNSNEKYRILHLLYSGLGGHGSVFFSLLSADKANEFDYTAAFCGVEPLTQDYIDRCIALRIPYHYFKKEPGLQLSIYGKIARYFLSSKPNVIFLHGGSFILSAVLTKMRRPGVRIIMRDPQAHHLKSRMDWIWLFLSMVFANRLVFLTDNAKQGAIKKFGWFAKKKKMVVIPNGLSMEQYRPVHREMSSGKAVLGMQSRLQAIKDHPTLIRAFKKLVDQYPGTDITLKIAGEGPTMEALVALTKELGISNKVDFTGMLGADELRQFMSSLDIYVHATYGETMSNSIMQALACGLPVIASDVWGVNNMIRPEVNGVLYPSEDVDSLVAYMNRFLVDVNDRKQMGEKARNFAEANYSNETMFAKYRQLFTN